MAVKCKQNLNVKKFNEMSVGSSLIICSLLKGNKKAIDMNNIQRMQLCLKILTTPSLLKSVLGVQKILSDQGKRIFQKFLEGHSRLLRDNHEVTDQVIITQPDEKIVFR